MPNGAPWQPPSGSQPKPLGTGEGEAPLAPPIGSPPAPKVEARTMASDSESIRTSGGSAPQPYVPKPAAPPMPPPPPPPRSGVFTPPQIQPTTTPPPPRPPVPPIGPAPIAPGVPPKPKSKRGLIVGLVSFLVVVGLAAIGYFFLYPIFFAEETPPAPPTPPPAAPTPPTPPETPPVPPSPFEGIQGLPSHTSRFAVPADATVTIEPAAPTLAAWKAALPTGTAEVALFRELTVKLPDGKIMPFAEVAKLLVPNFFTDAMTASFEPDATYYAYTNRDGTWFGLAAALKTGASLGAAQDAMSALQRDAANVNFFAADPGAAKPWKDARIGGRSASLGEFSAPGAALSYVWVGNTLLISTNVAGAEEAAKRLSP